jgi:hypothetical protein
MKMNIYIFLASCIFCMQIATAQDSCLTATPITAGLTIVSAINGSEIPNPICASNGDIPSNRPPAGEWYSYTPTQNYMVTVTTSIAENTPTVDTRFHVYTGTCGTLNCYSGDDDSGSGFSSIASFNVSAGTTYIIAFDNRWTSNGFTFQLIENPFVAPIPTPITYQNVTVAGGSSSYQICVVDMNGDYKDDIVGVSNNNLKINFQGNAGVFTTTNFPITGSSMMPTWSMAAGDLNKDGYNDLLLGSGNGVSFWTSNATGTAYTSTTPGQYIFCQRTNFADLNGDGHLDAFSCHDIAPNCYYLNDGANNFTFYQTGVTPGAMSLGAIGGNYATIFTDYDNDGDADMFVSKCSGPPCELHRNDGNGNYMDVSIMAQINITPVQSWSSAVADFDNDGDMDILIGSNGSTGHYFFRNNLDTSNSVEEAFTNITVGSGWDTDNSTNRDYIAYDFDNDGFVDVMSGGGRIMFNLGNGTFTPVEYPGMYLGAVGDLNNDGFLDVLNGSTIRTAVPNGNNWVKIALQGIQSNSNGIGARVEAYGTWGKQIRDVRSGEGFQFMSTLNTHFGIGQATAIEKIIIRWPSGVVDTITGPAINESITVVEGSTLLAVNTVSVAAFNIYPNPANDVLNIQLSENIATIKNAEIYDLAGRLVLSPEMTNHIISVKPLSTGSYILLLKDVSGKMHTQKFIKN